MSESKMRNPEPNHEGERRIHCYVPSQEEERTMWRSLFPNEDMSPHTRYEDDMTICLVLGDKKLLLYTMDSQEYDALIVKIDGERISGATTSLFQEVNQIMQRHTNQTGERHFFDFATKDGKMIAWAEEKGRDIFHWDKIRRANENAGETQIFSKVYLPIG